MPDKAREGEHGSGDVKGGFKRDSCFGAAGSCDVCDVEDVEVLAEVGEAIEAEEEKAERGVDGAGVETDRPRVELVDVVVAAVAEVGGVAVVADVEGVAESVGADRSVDTSSDSFEAFPGFFLRRSLVDVRSVNAPESRGDLPIEDSPLTSLCSSFLDVSVVWWGAVMWITFCSMNSCFRSIRKILLSNRSSPTCW